MSCYWQDYPQGSDEWLKGGIGKLTASHMNAAMARLKNGKSSEARTQLIYEIAGEQLTGQKTEVYVNDAMKWGIRYEPAAREMYEDVTGNIVQICGRAIHPEIPNLGASPDGLIGDKGVLEIKCPNTSTFLRYVHEGVVPERYVAQIILQLVVTGREWADFVAYDPRIRFESRRIWIKRFVPTEEQRQEVLEAAISLLQEVDALVAYIKEGKYGNQES